MKKNKAYVLDTSAIFCFKDNEEGASVVEEILEAAEKEGCEVFVSFISMMEYLYITLIREGEELARRAYMEFNMLPIKIIESDEELRLVAAELKASYNISLADAWIAATTIIKEAVLIHKDPEFEIVRNFLRCQSLPYK